MSEAFRDISPDAPELQPIISGLFRRNTPPATAIPIFPRVRKWS